MTTNDHELKQIVAEKQTIEIINKPFIVESNKTGSCDGCYFYNKAVCPPKATRICTSNGGNILVINDKK